MSKIKSKMMLVIHHNIYEYKSGINSFANIYRGILPFSILANAVYSPVFPNKMKDYKFLFLILFIVFFCPILTADMIPSSRRSKIAIKKVTPRIQEELKDKGLVFGSNVYIRIFKKSSELEVWLDNGGIFKLFKSYPICYYSGALGPKIKQGDNQSPEGFYFVRPKQLNPYSQFHLSFNIGYPNSFDRAHNRTGSALMVHGNCVSIGCYAMTDNQIEDIYALIESALRIGQPFFRVHIFPFRMTSDNMEKHKNSKWFTFWKNLQEGYDLFETKKRPPNVLVKNGRYVFEIQ